MPEGHDSIENMYRLCVYNDMIHNGSLKAPSEHAIDVKKLEGKEDNTSLLHMIIPSIMKNLEECENGLFTKNLATRQTWLERSALRCEMYFRLGESSIHMLKNQITAFVVDQLIVTKISLRDMELFLKTRLAVFKHVVKHIFDMCKRRHPNSAETFIVLKMYTQIVDGILHRQRTSERTESDKSNLGYPESAFLPLSLNLDTIEALKTKYGKIFRLHASIYQPRIRWSMPSSIMQNLAFCWIMQLKHIPLLKRKDTVNYLQS
jgi:hypothetical protein